MDSTSMALSLDSLTPERQRPVALAFAALGGSAMQVEAEDKATRFITEPLPSTAHNAFNKAFDELLRDGWLGRRVLASRIVWWLTTEARLALEVAGVEVAAERYPQESLWPEE